MANCPDTNPLRRDGLSQAQRRTAALDPQSVQLDDRTDADLLDFARAYAAKSGLRFFPLHAESGSKGQPGVWEKLMEPPKGGLAQAETRSDNPPHLALFMAFLKLFGLAQDQLNDLPRRHLDFYYRQVLHLGNRPAQPDYVHVLFELARNVAEQTVPAGAGLDGGRDRLQQPRLYQTLRERVVNQARLDFLRSVHVTPGAAIRFAPATNTSDGVAAALPAADAAWNAFGPKPAGAGAGAPVGIGWPTPQIGFALASPVLLMAEGERKITVTLRGQAGSVARIKQAEQATQRVLRLRVEVSGPGSWLDAGEAVLTVGADGTLSFTVTLPESEKQAVVGYNSDKLPGGYATTAPMLRAWVSPADYALLRGVKVTHAKVAVQVKGLRKTLVLENDLGRLHAEKPFQPFGPLPAKGSTWYIDSPEAARKSLSSINLRISGWANKPTNAEWGAYYAAYPLDYRNADNITVSIKVQQPALSSPSTAFLFSSFTTTNGLLLSSGAGSRAGKLLRTHYYQGYQQVGGRFFLPARVNAAVSDAGSVSSSLVQLTLTLDLGHSRYPQLTMQAAQAMAIQAQLIATGQLLPPIPPIPLPNPAYTPQVQALELDYAAASEANLSALNGRFSQREVQLFHHAPFGQAEEHAFLKSSVGFLPLAEQTQLTLLPQLADGGTFLMGLRGVGGGEIVAVLFQLAEGSANPLRPPARIRWSVLNQNQWQPLTGELTPSDYTNQLLTSGIIEFHLPLNLRLDNTLLEAGVAWLKAELLDSTGQAPGLIDSVGNLLALHPQAVLARFADLGNDPAHAALPLPAGSIGKLRQSLPGIKDTRQPYPSFGGMAAESEQAFYTRVSERLRHKQRAVSIWDYEHLVLQAFPGIYKVKCLNHTRFAEDPSAAGAGRLLEMAPGYVTVVVVPDLRNAYNSNVLEPRVDVNTLSAVERMLRGYCGQHAEVQVVNPGYELVTLDFWVRFRPGYAEAAYSRQLQRDLVAYLSPWAYDSAAEVPLGGTLYKSTVLAYLEQRPYVDFITELRMRHLTGSSSGALSDAESITASDARAVLTSSLNHIIRPLPL